MRKSSILITVLCIAVIFLAGLAGYNSINKKPSDKKINSTEKNKVNKASTTQINDIKAYKIPLWQRKRTYSVTDFNKLFKEFQDYNKIKSENYSAYDITPEDVKKELGCQIFKVNYTCDTFVIYKSKLFPIGRGFGGFGTVSINTCDFDNDGQKDLIYTYSWGSGLHRSQIGIYDLSKGKEEILDFIQRDEDVILEKLSDNKFNVYTADIVLLNESDLVHFNTVKKEKAAEIRSVNGKIKIKKYN